MTIPSGAETASPGVKATLTRTASGLRERFDLRLHLLRDALGAEAEVGEHGAALARRAEPVDPDRGVDPALPAERRRRLHRDLERVRRQHGLPVVAALLR